MHSSTYMSLFAHVHVISYMLSVRAVLNALYTFSHVIFTKTLQDKCLSHFPDLENMV